MAVMEPTNFRTHSQMYVLGKRPQLIRKEVLELTEAVFSRPSILPDLDINRRCDRLTEAHLLGSAQSCA